MRKVEELTIQEIKDYAQRPKHPFYVSMGQIPCFIAGGEWAKSRSDEYWKQEVAKKDQEIEQLKESQVEFGEWMILSGYAKLHFNEDSLSVSDIHTTYLNELNNKSQI